MKGKYGRIILVFPPLILISLFINQPCFAESGSHRLHAQDLVYQGAFAFPEGDEWTYSGQALAYYPHGHASGPADGYPGSLYTAGHAWNDLVGEITIPVPVISHDFSKLPKASVLRSPTDITGGWKDNCTFSEGCLYRELDGLEYLPNINKIVWNLRDWYNVAAFDQDSLGWSDPDMTNARGVWHIGKRSDPEFHNARTCNYLFKAPVGFATKYLDGKRLIAGNHREAGALDGSQGPTLYALAPWEDGNPPASGQNLDALALVYYPEIYDCVWGDPDLCHFPDYRAKDDWGGGAWVQMEDKSAILIFGRKGLGESCYGTQQECSGDPCDPYKGYHAYPYEPQILFYDQEELKEVVAGTRAPWEVLPYEVYRPVSEVFDPGCGIFGAVAYDSERRLIYVTEQTAGPWDETVVHVWKIDAQDAVSILYVDSNDQTCGGNSPCYTSIQEGIDHANEGSIIKITQGTYGESIVLNQSKALEVTGGWNSGFTTQSGDTSIKSITIGNGTVTMDNMVIE